MTVSSTSSVSLHSRRESGAHDRERRVACCLLKCDTLSLSPRRVSRSRVPDFPRARAPVAVWANKSSGIGSIAGRIKKKKKANRRGTLIGYLLAMSPSPMGYPMPKHATHAPPGHAHADTARTRHSHDTARYCTGTRILHTRTLRTWILHTRILEYGDAPHVGTWRTRRQGTWLCAPEETFASREQWIRRRIAELATPRRRVAVLQAPGRRQSLLRAR